LGGHDLATQIDRAGQRGLTVYGVQVQRLSDSTTPFDITNWWNGGTGSPNVSEYTVDENAGVQTPAIIPY